VTLNLAVVLRESALAGPEKAALVHDELRLTYDHLDALSNQVAAGLRAAGVRRGDRVALLLPNVPQLVIAYYGILKAGAVVVPLPASARAADIAYFLADSGARRLVASDDLAGEALRGAADVGDVETYVVQRGRDRPPAGARPFTELLSGSPRPDVAGTDPGDTAAVVYTAGTSGEPRGAELTHLNLFMGCHVCARLVEAREGDVTLVAGPLSDPFAQGAMNAAVYTGGTMTLVPRFDAERVMDVVRRDRVTVLCGLPATCVALLHHPDTGGPRASSLRLCAVAGGQLPAESLRAFEARFDVPVVESYGLAETATAVSVNPGGGRRRDLSAGRPIWGVEARVVDREGAPLPAGPDHVGEIAVRGHNVARGYAGRPEAAAAGDGWLRTGDLGYADEDGYLFLVDRVADVVVRAGCRVYPRQVEAALRAHPTVAEAAVVGVPDERLGEDLLAVVQAKPGRAVTAAELLAHCRSQLPPDRQPGAVRLVDQLPVSPSGRVLKRALRARA
jgi:long-chain acyl-CoA synthetase